MTIDTTRLRTNIQVKVDKLVADEDPTLEWAGGVLKKVGQVGIIYRVRAGTLGEYAGMTIEVGFDDDEMYVFKPEELSLVEQI